MAVSTAQTVRNKIEKMKPGEVFDHARFKKDGSSDLSIAKSLSRMAKDGAIVRLTKGKYYKPKNSVFGRLRPSEPALIEALTIRNNKRIGYVTGLFVFNEMGLTTQVPNNITIGTNKPLPQKLVAGYKIKYVKRNVDIREQNIPLLRILDAIQEIKHIPDTSPDEALKVLIAMVKKLSEGALNQLVKLSLQYNARTSALLGAILEYYLPDQETGKLANSLNKLSSYKMGISKSVLPNQSNWNIK